MSFALPTLTDAEIDELMASSGRACGTCQACCELIAVRELAKPYQTRCTHQCKAGCGVYPTRPTSCREYSCAWLAGAGPEGDRPDRSRVLVELNEEAADGRLYADVYAWDPAVPPADAVAAADPQVRFLRAMNDDVADRHPDLPQLAGVRFHPPGKRVGSVWDPDLDPADRDGGRLYQEMPAGVLRVAGLPTYYYMGRAGGDGRRLPEPTDPPAGG